MADVQETGVRSILEAIPTTATNIKSKMAVSMTSKTLGSEPILEQKEKVDKLTSRRGGIMGGSKDPIRSKTSEMSPKYCILEYSSYLGSHVSFPSSQPSPHPEIMMARGSKRCERGTNGAARPRVRIARC